MKDQPSTKKQIVYPTFNVRILSALVDLMWLMLLVIPVAKLSSYYLIYNKVLPQAFLQSVIETHQEELKSGMGAWQFFTTTPELRDYFITNGGFVKMVLDQLLQFSFVGACTILFWLYFSSTPGKMLFSVKVVDAKTFEKPSLLQSIIRFCSYIISLLPLGYGLISLNFDKQKRTWHDKIAGTLVIKR